MSLPVASQGGTELVPATAAYLPKPADLPDSAKSETRLGYLIAFGFFVVLLGWAAIARLDAAAAGDGVVSVAGNRQTVQHRDGGTVHQVLVKEGQHVTAGQTLVRLSAAEVEAKLTPLGRGLFNLRGNAPGPRPRSKAHPIKSLPNFATCPRNKQQLT